MTTSSAILVRLDRPDGEIHAGVNFAFTEFSEVWAIFAPNVTTSLSLHRLCVFFWFRTAR